jgi:hypothetical protein
VRGEIAPWHPSASLDTLPTPVRYASSAQLGGHTFNPTEDRTALSDRQLVERFRDGDHDAFLVINRRYQARLKKYLKRYLDDRIEDVVQDGKSSGGVTGWALSAVQKKNKATVLRQTKSDVIESSSNRVRANSVPCVSGKPPRSPDSNSPTQKES